MSVCAKCGQHSCVQDHTDPLKANGLAVETTFYKPLGSHTVLAIQAFLSLGHTCLIAASGPLPTLLECLHHFVQISVQISPLWGVFLWPPYLSGTTSTTKPPTTTIFYPATLLNLSVMHLLLPRGKYICTFIYIFLAYFCLQSKLKVRYLVSFALHLQQQISWHIPGYIIENVYRLDH